MKCESTALGFNPRTSGEFAYVTSWGYRFPSLSLLTALTITPGHEFHVSIRGNTSASYSQSRGMNDLSTNIPAKLRILNTDLLDGPSDSDKKHTFSASPG